MDLSVHLSSMISSMWTLQINSSSSSLQAATMAERSLSISSWQWRWIQELSYLLVNLTQWDLSLKFTLWLVSKEAPFRFRLAQRPATWLTSWPSYCRPARDLRTDSSKTRRSSCLSSGSLPPDIFRGLGLSTLVCLPTPPRPPLPKLPARTRSDMPAACAPV